MDNAIEARRKAQDFIDRVFPGSSSTEFEGVKIPIPRWIRYHSNPGEFKVDHMLPSREAAIDAIAQSTWARGWSAGMLRAFQPNFEALPEAERERMISEWAHKLAAQVVREKVSA